MIVSVSVAGDGLLHDQTSALIALREDRIDERLLAGDATLWGSDAEEEAAKRLGWLTAPEASWAFVPELRFGSPPLRVLPPRPAGLAEAHPESLHGPGGRPVNQGSLVFPEGHIPEQSAPILRLQ